MKMGMVAIATLVMMPCAWAQNGPGTTVTYVGLTEVVDSTAGCDAIHGGIGVMPRGVYRYKNSASDPNDSLSFFFDTESYQLTSLAYSGTLNGGVNSNQVLIDAYSGYTNDNGGSSNLTIASTGSTSAIPVANNIRIVGTINNPLFVPNCTISIRAVLTKKASQ